MIKKFSSNVLHIPVLIKNRVKAFKFKHAALALDFEQSILGKTLHIYIYIHCRVARILKKFAELSLVKQRNRKAKTKCIVTILANLLIE